MNLDWSIFSYIGLGFALIYRIPQIRKIYRTKRAEDLSSYSYLTHNGAYLSFIIYLVGTQKTHTEWVLCTYYFIGITQNLLIYGLKKYFQPTSAVTTPTANQPQPIIDK